MLNFNGTILEVINKKITMKYLSLAFICLLMSCNSTKKTNTQKDFTIVDGELIAVLKNPKDITSAKAWVTNSGLTWDKLLFDQDDLKIVLIKVPTKKQDFWLKRLQDSGEFSSVEFNQRGTFTQITKTHQNSLIKLRKTACFGKCPIYELTIDKNGKLYFDGLDFVLVKGKKEIQLRTSEFQALKEHLEKTTFSSYEEAYNNPRITDLPSTYITYQGKQIQIRTWNQVPPLLKAVVKYIETLTKTHKLVP